MNRRWTPEEDELIYRYGSQMPLPQLAEFLKKKTGFARSESAICVRRHHLDPAWNVDPVGYISFHMVTAHGARNTAINEAAMRQAIADGVLKRRYVGGYKRVFVPVKWADEWIAKRDAAHREYDRLRAEGWMTTAEVAQELGMDRKATGVSLSRRTQLDGMYQVFRDVEKIVAYDNSNLWEPMKMRAAIAAFKRMKQSTACPNGWWGINRAARELGISHKSLRPLALWLMELGFDKLRMKTNAANHLFWHPEDIEDFRRKHAKEIAARRKLRIAGKQRRSQEDRERAA